ncbi:discoidin domain-containing protein [Metasolibacillus meyeri]|uniref:Discoidin domain-containing protein n=1 Tax=Metasolibacillus meyeri TaxID=1071052 RepID=A0AAW9NS80_9BACL|nr:discoidin domain-containing protein [Metasolibacillus meyeri]MEC1179202.1 discoidin domain-containing protein [Metasolibacillus meyeri]
MELVWHNIKMTSNNNPSPYMVTTSSNYSSSYAGWMAFDGANSNTSICWSSNANTGWINFDFGENNKQKIACVEISARVTTVNGAPKDFTIEISDDNLNWTTVKTVTNEIGWISAQSRQYMLTSNYLTRYIRINVSANNGRVRLDIGEIRFAYISRMDKSLILHDSEYKKWDIGTPEYTSTNVVPVMTNNSAPAPFVISSSSEQSTFPSWRAFNGVLSEATAWMTESGVVSNAWIQVKLNSPRILAELKVTSRNGLGYDTHSPKDFKLLGSNDGSNWETIISISNQINWGSGETRKYLFNNSNSFIFYRLLVESNNGGVIIAIGEIELIGKALSAVHSHWKTVSDILPKSNQFLENGMYLSPLLDRNVTELEPITMEDKSEILDVDEIGKVFSKTIDLKKYFDIRSMKVEVKECDST